MAGRGISRKTGCAPGMSASLQDWTTPEEITKRVRRDWDNGRLLGAMLVAEPIFPLRMVLKIPDTQALANQFVLARQWIALLVAGEPGYQLEWREFNHRQLGRNRIPVAAIITNQNDALALIGKQREAKRFLALATAIIDRFPALATWICKRALKVLEHAESWPQLLGVLDWVYAHPHSGIYMRQINVPGVDTKFIERNRGLLAELLDIVLPAEYLDSLYTGVSGFELRYGFRPKPVQIRFRFLDQKLRIQGLSDLAVNSMEFAQLDLPVQKVFITENEINFLAFPDMPDSLILFGAGYGFEHLAHAQWLQKHEIYYWGDIDTHGFAILDQLRSKFPSAQSLLMDRATLLAHRVFWGQEQSATDRELTRLQPAESELYDDLRHNRIAPGLRLEQERIAYAWVLAALKN